MFMFSIYCLKLTILFFVIVSYSLATHNKDAGKDDLVADDDKIPFPNISNVLIVGSIDQMIRLREMGVIETRPVLFLFTYQIAADTYLALYLSAWAELLNSIWLQGLKGDQEQLIIIIFESFQNSDSEMEEKVLQLLPTNSIMISYQHGMMAIDIQGLCSFRSQYVEFLRRNGRSMYNHVSPRIIYHVNHEQPWTNSPNSIDYTFDSIEILGEAYDKFDLVLRNYYYSPLLNHSVYVPVGAPFSSFIITNSSSPVQAVMNKPASMRNLRCFFKGRADYDYFSTSASTESTHEGYNNGVEERQDLFKVYRKDIKDTNVAQVYAEYMGQLADTTFALCPGGNNPETFRLHEAMEMGAIPILVKIKDPKKDFLQHELWDGYPGPVLSSWEELPEFLNRQTAKEIDVLQLKIARWHVQFKMKIKAVVKRAIEGVMVPPQAVQRDPRFSSKEQLERDERDRQSAVGIPATKAAEVERPDRPESDERAASAQHDIPSKEESLSMTKMEELLRTAIAQISTLTERVESLEASVRVSKQNEEQLLQVVKRLKTKLAT